MHEFQILPVLPGQESIEGTDDEQDAIEDKGCYERLHWEFTDDLLLPGGRYYCLHLRRSHAQPYT